MNKKYSLAMLAIVNGILGTSTKRPGWGFVTGDWSDKKQVFTKFYRTPGT